MVIVAEAAQEDAAEVAGADVTEEFEVAEVECAVGGEGSGGLDGGPLGVALAVRAAVEVGDRGGGGGGGETGLVETKCDAGPGKAAAGTGGGEGGGGGDGGAAGEAEVQVGVCRGVREIFIIFVHC